jgi:hypothetical protein
MHFSQWQPNALLTFLKSFPLDTILLSHFRGVKDIAVIIFAKCEKNP